jgi:predicted ATPase/DNA-binding CsgD family transcriptional regulator
MLREGILKAAPFSTSFIDRPTETQRITHLLAHPECRLLTLAGVGGSGKTRLAIEIAARQSSQFGDGVYFVPLQPLPDPQLLASAIADAIGISFSGQKEPVVQLLHFLRERQMLLLLDNFEHLLGGIPLLIQILEAAPNVKLLVTTREVLNIQQEWLCQVRGLPVPFGSNDEDLERFGSTRLFIERGRQFRADFSAEEEQANIVRICQLVEGLPLAVEIAASWTRSMSCGAIVSELQRNFDLLTARLVDIPERQRSMQAVFEQSWQRLTDEQRNVFKRLSVFRGGFDPAAAKEVSGATLAILSEFIDKCLLTPAESGHYHIHELLRQFAESKIEDAAELRRLRGLHRDYFAAYLENRTQSLIRGKHLELIQDVKAELENIRIAWAWAIQSGETDAIRKSVNVYYHYCQFQSRYQEGMQALEDAIHCLNQQKPDLEASALLADLLNDHGWLLIRLGQFERARVQLERCLAILEREKVALSPAIGSNPLSGLAILAVIHGEYGQAMDLGRRALRFGENLKEDAFLSFAHYALASATLAQGKYREAGLHAREACTRAQATHNRWFMAYCLIPWGDAARLQGDLAEAKRHYKGSYAIRRDFSDPEGMALALNHLGEVALLEGDVGEAKHFYRESLGLYQQIDDPGGLATTFHGLSRSASTAEDYSTSAEYLRQAYQIAAGIGFLPLTLAIMASAGELFIRTGQKNKGLEYLNFVFHHPSGDHVTQDKARGLIEKYGGAIRPEGPGRGGQPERFEALGPMLLIDLAEIDARPATITADPGQDAAKGHASLPDPLTRREREVLSLMAEGLSNPAMAERLIVSVGTVKTHTNRIYMKLGVKNRVQAIARARELDMLE